MKRKTHNAQRITHNVKRKAQHTRTFHVSRFTFHDAGGFTLIELLVTLGVMAILSSLLIVYTRGSESQIKILKEKAVVITMIQRARAFALNTLQSDARNCGYGVAVLDEVSLVMWRDVGNKSCNDANGIYDGESENVGDVIHFVSGIIFRNRATPNFLESILFIPPDPSVTTSPPSVPGGQFQLVIGTPDGGSESTIGINRFGQVEPTVGY